MAAKYFLPILLFLALTACSSNNPAIEPLSTPNRIVYGLTLQPSGIDPHINSSSELGIPLRQVYDTLLYRDPTTKEFVAGLAASWSVSDDGLVYTFNLRQDVKFHDGTPFNAQAVAANLDRITNPENGSQKAVFMLGDYAGYDLVDAYTIRLRLSSPYSPLLDSLSQVYLGIASPTALAQYSLSRYQYHQVGTGPFQFIEYVPGDRIVLRRNADYAWGPAYYHPSTNNSIDEIEFRFFTDPPTRALAVESQGVQVMGELLPTDARSFIGNSTIRIIQVSIPGQPLQFIFNTKRFPTDSKTLRQALLYATNRNAIVDAVYQRFSPVAWGPLSASTLYYSREIQGTYDHDTTQAQALLTSAGYTDSDADGYIDINGVNLEITLIVPPWGLIPEVSQLLQDQWRTIGVKANLEPVPTRNALFEKVQSGEYNLVAFYSFGLDPSFLNQYFLSTSADNWTGFASLDLDNVLNEAVRQTNPDIRRGLYAQAQRMIMDEALILPIRDYVNLNATSATVEGLAYDTYGWFPILNNTSLLNPP